MSEEDFEDYNFDDDVSLDEEDKKHTKSDELEWYKGVKKGLKERVSLVYFHPVNITMAKLAQKKAKQDGKDPLDKDTLLKVGRSALLKRATELEKDVDELELHEKLDFLRVQFRKIPAHYKDGIGYVVSRLGKDGKDADRIWKMMDAQRNYFCTVLLVYPTDSDGAPDKNRFKTDWYVKPWRMGQKVYNRMHAVAASLRSNDLTIANQDLILKCTNPEFQNFDIDPAGKALWVVKPVFRNKVLAEAVKCYDKLKPFRELSTADLKNKLGIGEGDVGEDVSEEDFTDVLDNV